MKMTIVLGLILLLGGCTGLTDNHSRHVNIAVTCDKQAVIDIEMGLNEAADSVEFKGPLLTPKK